MHETCGLLHYQVWKTTTISPSHCMQFGIINSTCGLEGGFFFQMKGLKHKKCSKCTFCRCRCRPTGSEVWNKTNISWDGKPLVMKCSSRWNNRIQTDLANYDTVEIEQVNERQRGPVEHLIAKYMYKCAWSWLKSAALCAQSFPSHLSRVVQVSFSDFYHQKVWTQSPQPHLTPSNHERRHQPPDDPF